MKYTWYFIMIPSNHEFPNDKFIYIVKFEQAKLVWIQSSLELSFPVILPGD